MNCNITFTFLVLCVTLVFCQKSFSTYIQDDFVNKEVAAKIRTHLDGTNEANMTVIKMLDAWSKFPSGILEGHLTDLGSFDECYKIKYKDIYGKYCLGSLAIQLDTQEYFEILKHNQLQQTFLSHPELRSVGSLQLQFAACVPSSMTASEIPGLFTYTEDMCYSKAINKELSPGAIVTIVIITIFMCAVLLSTIYDVTMFYLKKEPHHELLIAFSFLTNGRKLFSSSQNSDQLLCLNGIKALSMMWVILGHEFSSVTEVPLTSNIFVLEEWQHDSANMFIAGATVSVDTFFVVGGLVTVYTFLRSMEKKAKFNVFQFYIHRYLRLTPALSIMMLMYLFLIEYLGNGPLWNYTMQLFIVNDCKTGWWRNLLYISNYFHQPSCIGQTWYLSVDMQLFILSPIVLITLLKKPKIGLWILRLLIVAGCIIPFTIGYGYNLSANMMDANKSQDYTFFYYYPTHTRFGPYVIGLLLGYYIYKLKKSELTVRLRWWMVICLWSILITGLVACVYAGYPLNVATEEDRWGNSLFLAFNRPAWAVVVSGVIFLCVAGYGGPIDSFLSLPVFQFLTKLSYSMYLVHSSVIVVRYGLMRDNIRFSNLESLHVFWGDFMFTVGLSLILCLTFESPIIVLEKYLFGRRSAKVDSSNIKKEEP